MFSPSILTPPPWPATVLVGCLGLWITTLMQSLRRERLENQLLKARCWDLARQVQGLTVPPPQLNTHFLFNALNTVRHFVRVDPARARNLLVDLAEYFKSVVDSHDPIRLSDELDRVAAYLNLEHARLEDRLEIAIDIDRVPLSALCPTGVLVPLATEVIERACKDGVSCRLTLSCEVSPSEISVVFRATSLNPLRDSQRLAMLKERWGRLAGDVHIEADQIRLILPGGTLL